MYILGKKLLPLKISVELYFMKSGYVKNESLCDVYGSAQDHCHLKNHTSKGQFFQCVPRESETESRFSKLDTQP